MEGISKARLIEIYNNYVRQNKEYACVVNSIISECKELDPWMPIENAPKDRPIAVYCPSYQDLEYFVSKCKWHESAGFCVDELRTPTLWQELPND